MAKLRSKMVDIACLVRISDETSLVAVRQAIALCQGAGAHLTVFLGVQSFVAPYTPFGGGMVSSITNDINTRAMAHAESLSETINREAGAAGVEVEIVVATGPFAEVAAQAANAARSADLVVVDQQHGALDTAEMLLEEALFRSGRPVLIATPKCEPLAEVRKVVVGWDGSAHAVRAVSSALAVFPTIETVEIVTVSGEKSLTSGLSANQFSRHLARKGVDARLTDLESKGRPVASVLNEYAGTSGADILITGAFGHARLWEFLLGGVTVELTENASVPVLMAY